MACSFWPGSRPSGLRIAWGMVTWNLLEMVIVVLASIAGVSSSRSSIDPPVPQAAHVRPMLLFRLSGSFLLRLAERQFLALLFQLPPRSTGAPALATAAPRVAAVFCLRPGHSF